ncbi:probable serine/threonine-protein kinase WNK6 [Macadamia integrifolia]|uniref:probable serine/threonine-protein kinase WNK6 n=1 Tax=Macadamia integrifolia TaxID=60698 RepID=UPI001C4F8782|nr:probable serine/threonine-protein kinase WNK6 [Macadamia integrifolia]
MRELRALDADCAKNIDVLFYHIGDTFVTVAREIVEQLELADQNVKFVAAMIDLIMTTDQWRFCILIDHQVGLNGTQIAEGHVKYQLPKQGESSTGSFQNAFEKPWTFQGFQLTLILLLPKDPPS